MTGFSEQALSRPRGRPTELSDPQLCNRRDRLVQIFEGSWGEIGWVLQRCKKADDLISIFTPIADPKSWVHEPLSIFCRQSSETASGAVLRKLRTERRELVVPIRIADESKRGAEEQLQKVNRALSQAKKCSRRIVKRARKAKRKEFWKAAQEYRDLSKRERELDQRLRELEASFARQELLRFLRSKRYVVTPTSLANAAAGLPYMGWRHSTRRCLKEKSKLANGLSYQIFKAICYIASTANKRTENALVASFRERIPSLPSRYQAPRSELAEKWLYLERAVRQAYRSNPHPKALVCEITKRYFKLIRSYSEVDVILAEQARLALPKQRKGSLLLGM